MDYIPSSRRLSDISHLFLSDVRKKQTGDDARPARTPPGGFTGDVSVDLTPEEFANMMTPTPAGGPAFKPLRAVIAHHFGETMTDRVRDLAVATSGDGPVGVIYADGGTVRVCFVDPRDADDGAEEAVTEPLNTARLREVLVELDQDVKQWLLVLPDHRSPDTQAVLARARHWTLLTAADHDGVVAAYRALKGVCGDNRPTLGVSVCDPADADEADKSARKLAGVCEQFLKVGLAVGPVVRRTASAREVCLLEAAGEAGGETHWAVLAALADGAADAPVAAARPVVQTPAPVTAFDRPAPVMRSVPAPPTPADDVTPTVIDLPDADASPAAMLRAVIEASGEWTGSSISPPALPDAVVAVSRDRRLTLLAVARPGLADWRTLASALRWMAENRGLIAMAAPHLNIDAALEPRLHVLVDAADAAALAAHPLLASGGVTAAGYRKVRWAGRTGLLLDAA